MMAVSRVLVSVLVVVFLVAVPRAHGQPTEEEYDAFLAARMAAHHSTMATLGAPPAPGVFETAASSPPATPTCIKYVGKKGSGAEFTKVKSAVKAIPDGMTERCVIMVGEGVYE